MNITEAASFSYQSLSANKMRAGLTMLGMVIGTASIILVVTIALTSRDYVLQQIQGIGANLIYVYRETVGSNDSTAAFSDELTIGDIEAVQLLPTVANVAAIQINQDTVTIDGREKSISVIGTNPSYYHIRNLRMLSGRFFDASDDRTFSKVCILTGELAKKLFGTLEVRGQSMKLFQVRFEVIGVFKEGAETFGTSEVASLTALVPLSVMRHFNMSDRLDQIYASARTSELVPLTTERIRLLIETRHRRGAAYRVENLTAILQAAGRIAAMLTAVLFLIGAISLIISGIGIMNIMLVTVTERTREIGIKMAIGAKRREILFQFLTESLFMAVTGGILGIALGISGPLLAKWIGGLDIPISWTSILVAFGLSLLVGVTFGLVPANRAAKLNPSEALRYE
jgi:putative ABC transport system permease protein